MAGQGGVLTVLLFLVDTDRDSADSSNNTVGSL